MRKKRVLLGMVLTFAAAVNSGCAHQHRGMSLLGTPCTVADDKLKQDWRALNEALNTPDGCAAENGMRCEALRARIERLSVDCPANNDVLMANALLSFEKRDFVRTQQLIDQLASHGASYPEAAILRARIALQDGNAQFALRFLEQQIKQTGDSAGLRETYASTLYFVKRWDDAAAQLVIARKLGAPVWRVAYGLGLIEEAAGRFNEAKGRYEEALQDRPAWKPAESRLRALAATGRVKNP